MTDAETSAVNDSIGVSRGALTFTLSTTQKRGFRAGGSGVRDL